MQIPNVTQLLALFRSFVQSDAKSYCVFIVTLNWKRQFFNLVSLRLHEFSPQALVLVLPSNIYLRYHDRRSQCRNF